MIDQSLQKIVESLGARSPTPGGGSAAAMAAAMGTALLLMVVRFSRGKKANLDRDAELAEAEQVLAGLVERLLPMAERDCGAYDLVSQAYQLPVDSEGEVQARGAAIEVAMVGAMSVPDEMLLMVRDVLRATNEVVSCVGKAIAGDLGSAAELLRAGAEAAYMNVRINAAELKDRELAESTMSRVEAVRTDVLETAAAFRQFVETRI
jgi:formiminotetrahydrofolate cyclodeaminase